MLIKALRFKVMDLRYYGNIMINCLRLVRTTGFELWAILSEEPMEQWMGIEEREQERHFVDQNRSVEMRFHGHYPQEKGVTNEGVILDERTKNGRVQSSHREI